jgi:hypothetical protein
VYFSRRDGGPGIGRRSGNRPVDVRLRSKLRPSRLNIDGAMTSMGP